MNRKFLVAWLVVFLAWFAGSFVVHGVLLRPDYMLLTNIFRPQEAEMQYMPLMLFAHVILSGAFVWIYTRGAEAAPWAAQGLRFGIAIAMLTVVPSYLIYFAIQPMPPQVVAKQIIFDGSLTVLLGMIVAWLYRVRAPLH